ncbi:enoyl-ACP reductase [bacterium]|nr:enoyl-ACP reductase [bacterium]
MGLLSGKKGLIVGVANSRSIAWGVAEAAAREGATLGFTYLEMMERRVRQLAESVGSPYVFELDVTNQSHLDGAAATVKAGLGEVDFVLHAVAFARKEDLAGAFVDTSREGFALALEVSAWSLLGLTHAVLPVLADGASVVTLSYLGANRVIPNYHVMGVAKAALEASVRYLAADLGPDRGIRVNAISAGPIKTLSAAGISDFSQMLAWNKANSPLRDNVTIGQVGDAAVYLFSDLSRAVTGEVHHVDMGYHTMGTKATVDPS